MSNYQETALSVAQDKIQELKKDYEYLENENKALVNIIIELNKRLYN